MNRFEYTTPVFDQNEVKLAGANNVRLYDGDTKTTYEGGEVVLTSYRLLWGRQGDIARGITCLSLPLQYIVYIEEESPGAFHFTRSSKLILHLSPPIEGKKPGPVQTSLNNYVKFSFKDGLESSFVDSLNEAVQLKKWESRPVSNRPSGSVGIKPRAGIVGIERGIQEKQKATDQSISAAFQDLRKLMEMAKEMVSLSKNISTKIREKQGSITEDETVQFKSYLLSLGIDDPVTRDSYSTESEYIKGLARELVEILQVPIQEQGGMMSLVDAYCRVNRARGLELLSPEDLLRAASQLERLHLSIRLRKFDSGVCVLQLASQTDSALAQSTYEMVKEKGSLTAEELSRCAGISVLLAKEHLISAEKEGLTARDDTIEGLRFYPNLFLEREP